MTVRSSVLIINQSREITILDVFTITSLIIIIWGMRKFMQLDALTSGVSSMLLEESLILGFWSGLVGPRPQDSVIYVTANSTLGITKLSIAVKIAS